MDSAKWYYLKSGRQRGPMDAGDLQGLLQSGALPPSTLVWTASQKDWLPAHASAIQNATRGARKTRTKSAKARPRAILLYTSCWTCMLLYSALWCPRPGRGLEQRPLVLRSGRRTNARKRATGAQPGAVEASFVRTRAAAAGR